MTNNSEFEPFVEKMRADIERVQTVHYEEAHKYKSWHYIVGVVAIILAGIAGASQFITVSEQMKTVVGIAGLVAAILAGIQTFLSLIQRSEIHRSVSAQLSQVRRQLANLKQWPPRGKGEQRKAVSEINNQLAQIEREAPTVKGGIILAGRGKD